MSKALCIFAMAISVLLVGLFGLDLAIKAPFGGAALVDGGFLLLAAILGYLSWSTFRELG
jgi:hypothetical protein